MKKQETIEKEVQKLLEKHHAELGYEIDFPIYRILPVEIELALKVLGKHGMRVKIVIREKNNLP